MPYFVDARDLACPQPVVLTKKALEDHDEVVVVVNDEVARGNVKKLAQALGCTVTEEERGPDTVMTLEKGPSCKLADEVVQGAGPVVVVISADTMGAGDDTLGRLLMKSFIHTLVDVRPRPDTVIFFNTGVKLAAEGSEVLDDLRALDQEGVRIRACGTCLNYFEIKDRLAVGEVSNMYDIAASMLGAARVVRV